MLHQIPFHAFSDSRNLSRSCRFADLQKEGTDGEQKQLELTLYDPDPEEVFEVVVPEYLAGLIYSGVCESVASELAARRTAMDAATKNAGEMIEQLNLYLQQSTSGWHYPGNYGDCCRRGRRLAIKIRDLK